MSDDDEYIEITDVALDERDRRVRAGDMREGFTDGVAWGAGWAFALIGMAQAIRESHLCRSCTQVYSADEDGTCQRCGHPHGWARR